MSHLNALHKLMELTVTESISTKQQQAWLRLMEKFSPETCMKAAEEIGPKTKGMPDFDDFRSACKKQGGTSPVSPPINRWWGQDGSWGGDWSQCRHSVLIWHYAMMAVNPWRGNTARVEEFRQLCLKRNIPVEILREALEKAQIGDYELTRYVERTVSKTAA